MGDRYNQSLAWIEVDLDSLFDIHLSIEADITHYMPMQVWLLRITSQSLWNCNVYKHCEKPFTPWHHTTALTCKKGLSCTLDPHMEFYNSGMPPCSCCCFPAEPSLQDPAALFLQVRRAAGHLKMGGACIGWPPEKGTVVERLPSNPSLR